MSAFALVLALGVISTISGHLVRSKRQADISCDEDETEIITEFLFTDEKTCPQLIGGISDWYNEDFRKECASWLNLVAVPTQVAQTYVSECYELNNGTTKYRTKICCPGQPNIPTADQLICFLCNNDLVQYDSQTAYYHTHHCNHHGTGPDVCDVGDVCAVELHYNTTYRRGVVTKSCMPASDCDSRQASNSATCTTGPTPYCAYCYDTMHGNYDHLTPQPWVYILGPCDPNPCYYGGTCLSSGTERTDPYTCQCRPGFSGSRCEISQCSSGPCENDGVCTTSYSAPYYTCGCHIPWTGYDCDEVAQPCATTNWCENGGTCYIQDGPEDRCLCPTGYVGKRCEYSHIDSTCRENGILTLGWNQRFDRYDCTYFNDVFVQAYLNSYQANCYSWLRRNFDTNRPQYTPGVHGEGGPNQEIRASSCEQGRDFTWATIEICCASCGSNPCQNGGWCIQDANSDGFTCRCRFNYGGEFCEKKLSSCYAAGDPHYYTFDGIRMHYQGQCKYVMAESPAVDDLPYFRVTTKNKQRDQYPDVVTFPKYAEIDMYNFTVRLTLDNQAYLNGALIIVPYNDPAGNFQILLNGLKLQFKTQIGLEVELSDNWLISVRVPADAAGQVDGLCRNFNDDAADDYILPDGTDVTHDPNRDIIIGNAFQVLDPEVSSCPPVDPNQSLWCDDATSPIIGSNAYCGYIKDTSGPFAQCISSASDGNMIEVYMENCIYDVCAVYNGGEEAMKTAACGSMAAFAAVCTSDASPASSDWRITTGCVPECRGDLVYKPLTTACGVTCKNPDPTKCSLPGTENCVCRNDTDVVLPDDICVHASVCGCYEEGRKIGETWCNEDYTVRSECVTCTDCARPVGTVLTFTVTNATLECPVPECPGELLYKHRITACRVNCENPDPATCSLPDTENCVCADDTHVILLNDTCVHASMCGCYEEGREIGETWCNDDTTVRSECVTCTDCARPVGKVVTFTVTNATLECPDPCQDMVCDQGDGSSGGGTTIRALMMSSYLSVFIWRLLY